VNSKPSSEAASDVSTKVASPSSDEAADVGPFKFCVSSSFTMSQVYITTFMYYILWGLLLAVLSQNRVWKFVRGFVIKFALGAAVFMDYVSGLSSVISKLVKGTDDNAMTLQRAVFFETKHRHRNSRTRFLEVGHYVLQCAKFSYDARNGVFSSTWVS